MRENCEGTLYRLSTFKFDDSGIKTGNAFPVASNENPFTISICEATPMIAGVDHVELYLIECLPIAKRASQLAANAASYVFFCRPTCSRLDRGSKAIGRSVSLVQLFVVIFLPATGKHWPLLMGRPFFTVLNPFKWLRALDRVG